MAVDQRCQSDTLGQYMRVTKRVTQSANWPISGVVLEGGSGGAAVSSICIVTRLGVINDGS